MIDSNGKIYRGLQAQVKYLTDLVEGGDEGKAVGVNKVTKVDLAVGEPALTYDIDSGASIEKQGAITAAGQQYIVQISDELPLIPGDNINIDSSEDGKHLVISAIGGGGTGVAGVSSFGGKTGDIRLGGSNLTMNGNTLIATSEATPVVIEQLGDLDAMQGTITQAQLATLRASKLNPIVKRNEYYWLNDNEHVYGTLGYTHIGYESNTWTVKNISITISTMSWVLSTTTIEKPEELPIVDLSLSSTNYPISGTFTDEQASKLQPGGYGVISLLPSGSPISIPLTLQPSEIIHNSYVYKGHDSQYEYTVNANLSITSGDVWLAKSYVITRAAYTAPVTTTIGGKSGDIALGENLSLTGTTLAATDTVTTVNGHTGAVYLVGGQGVNINDLGGTLTISTDGSGGGTSAGLKEYDIGNIYNQSGDSWTYSGQLSDEQAAAALDVDAVKFNYTVSETGTIYTVNALYQGKNERTSIYTYLSEIDGYIYKAELHLSQTSGDQWVNKEYTISKEVKGDGGSGGAALYQHNIEFMCDPSTKGWFTVYTSSSDQISSTTPWLMKFGNDKVSCGGMVVYNSQAYPLAYIQADDQGVYAYFGWDGMSSAVYKSGYTITSWTDVVKEV